MNKPNFVFLGMAALAIALASPFVLFVVVYILQAGVNAYGYPRPAFGFPHDLNSMGDSFGIANVIVSGFAFIALLWTIRQQQEGLEHQRKDVKTNQEHLRQSIKEMTETAKSTERMAQAQERANRIQFFQLSQDIESTISSHSSDYKQMRERRTQWIIDHYSLVLNYVTIAELFTQEELRSGRELLTHASSLIQLYVSEVSDPKSTTGPDDRAQLEKRLRKRRHEHEEIAKCVEKLGVNLRVVDHKSDLGGAIFESIKATLAEIENRCRFACLRAESVGSYDQHLFSAESAIKQAKRSN